ncbi:MAG TPA: hypothetical protein VFK80_07475 [Limnochordia bacterium]|nr:hypothetical protein [Limnochordia bacterium]
MQAPWTLQLVFHGEQGRLGETRLTITREIAGLVAEAIKRGEQQLAAEDQETGQIVQVDWSHALVLNLFQSRGEQSNPGLQSARPERAAEFDGESGRKLQSVPYRPRDARVQIAARPRR